MATTLSSVLAKLANDPGYAESVKGDIKSGVVSGAVKGGIILPALSMMALGHPMTALAAIPAGVIGGGLLSGTVSGVGSAVTSLSPGVRKSDDVRRGAFSGATGAAAMGAALPYAEHLHPVIKSQYDNALRYAERFGAAKHIPSTIHGRAGALAAAGLVLGGTMGALGAHLRKKTAG